MGSKFDPGEVLVERWGSMEIELGCKFGKLDYPVQALDLLGFGSHPLKNEGEGISYFYESLSNVLNKNSDLDFG